MIKHLHRLKGRKGFTLVELVVVIGIAAVLMAVILVGSLNGNTEDVLSANSNAESFFTASQLALTRAQLTERSIVDYESADTKFIEYKNGANTLNDKYLFIEAKFDPKSGIVGVHIDNYLDRLMDTTKHPADFSDMTALEKYIMTNLGEYMADSFDGYFYCMADKNFKVLVTHFCAQRLPEYKGDDEAFRNSYMVGTGTKLDGYRNVLGTCRDGNPILTTGDFAFNFPILNDAEGLYKNYMSKAA